MDPSSLLDLVKDNVVVQWFLVIIFILTVSTTTATKLSGPIGKMARWFQSIGDKRVNREAEERRRARQQLLRDAKEGRVWAEEQIDGLRGALGETNEALDGLEKLVREHLGWDYDRIHQLINMGVRPGDIPTPPPLKVPWRSPRTDTTEMHAVRPKRHAEPDSGEQVVVRADN
jgi:hypothetical protein